MDWLALIIGAATEIYSRKQKQNKSPSFTVRILVFILFPCVWQNATHTLCVLCAYTCIIGILQQVG